jgi:hypothetical protein
MPKVQPTIETPDGYGDIATPAGHNGGTVVVDHDSECVAIPASNLGFKGTVGQSGGPRGFLAPLLALRETPVLGSYARYLR